MTPRKIGITSTIPSEILFAAGAVPVDLNNLFMTDQDPMRFLRRAKMEGFPDTTCSWICGLYGVAMERGIDAVVTVIGGDCSESLALMEVLTLKGVEVIPFAYPHSPDPALLEGEMRRLASRLGTTLEAAEERKKEMDAIRSRLHYLDELLWRDHKATGEEVQLFQLSSSDFEGDIAAFSRRLEEKIAEIEVRPPVPLPCASDTWECPPSSRTSTAALKPLRPVSFSARSSGSSPFPSQAHWRRPIRITPIPTAYTPAWRISPGRFSADGSTVSSIISSPSVSAGSRILCSGAKLIFQY